ncbi:MAG: disulfide bond formation protein DsbA, partial [Caulobacteraceae bacterium]|nr:disulfide bond formation protein DsbA [Caulobacteraceae bacterium]
LGNPNAKVRMVEYHSVACPVCFQFATTVWPEFRAKYVDTGKVFYISREALTHDPTLAAVGFLMARCAGKDKYFGVVDALYQHQAELETQGADARGILLNIARSAGLTEAQFNACISDDKASAIIQKRWDKYTKDLSKLDPVVGTPTILINGKKIDNWAMPNLSAVVDAALK